jgi:ABC-type multidrug transport system fused ATPase/permease subunit
MNTNSSKKKLTLIHKLNFLLNSQQKKELFILSVLVFIGMLFEMVGLGVLIPAFGLITNPNGLNSNPVSQLLVNAFRNTSEKDLVLYVMLLIVLLYLFKFLFLIFLNWRQSKYSAEFSAELSSRFFLGYLNQAYSFHLQRNSAELLRNIRGEVNHFNQITQSVIILATEFTAVVGIGCVLIFQNPLGALIVSVLLGVVSFFVYSLIRKKLLNWGERRQAHEGEMNQHLLEAIRGIKEVKLYGKEENFLKKFDTSNLEVARVITLQYTTMYIPRLYLEFMAIFILAAAVIMITIDGQPLAGFVTTIGIFVAGAFRMIPSVSRIMGSIQFVRYSGPVIDVLYKEFELIRDFYSKNIERSFGLMVVFNKEILVKDINFTYALGDRRTLDTITIRILKGESVGFIGTSGSGKSTLIDIILGLLSPDSGEVLVDGSNINDNIRSWQNQIGYVPQTIFLLDDTIRRNVAFGIPDGLINNGAVEKAINSAQLTDFINKLPQGLDTLVGENGVRLSGGQRQRIGLARALYNDPPLLVLDEATSALDSKTEVDVMEAVFRFQQRKTIIIVAHRLSTLHNCDRIYNLENGKIIQNEKPN